MKMRFCAGSRKILIYLLIVRAKAIVKKKIIKLKACFRKHTFECFPITELYHERLISQIKTKHFSNKKSLIEYLIYFLM